MEPLERRFIKSQIEARSTNGKKVISGYAAVFNSPSDPMLGFKEKCCQGMFSRALEEGQDCKFLVNHDPSLLLARTTNNTLRLLQDSYGLHFDCDIPDTTLGADTYELIRTGIMSACSFSFIPRKQRWVRDADSDEKTRELLDVDILDASCVTYPCYPATSVGANSFLDFEELEDPDTNMGRMVPLDGLHGLYPARTVQMFPCGAPIDIEVRAALHQLRWKADLEIGLARFTRQSRQRTKEKEIQEKADRDSRLHRLHTSLR